MGLGGRTAGEGDAVGVGAGAAGARDSVRMRAASGARHTGSSPRERRSRSSRKWKSEADNPGCWRRVTRVPLSVSSSVMISAGMNAQGSGRGDISQGKREG